MDKSKPFGLSPEPAFVRDPAQLDLFLRLDEQAIERIRLNARNTSRQLALEVEKRRVARADAFRPL